MSTTTLNEQTVLDALRQVKYPGFSRDIVSFGFVKDLTIGGGNVSFRLALTTDAPAAAEALKRECETRPAGRSPASPPSRSPSRPPRPQPPVIAGAIGRKDILKDTRFVDRRRVRQGRRRQVDRLGEPRDRAQEARLRGRPHGLGHLRPVAADDDGHHDEAVRERGGEDPPDRALRRARHVDRLPDGRRHARHLARADDLQGRRAVPRRRGLGQAGFPARRSSARHGRRAAHAHAEGRALGRRHRDDAAGRRAHRRAQGPRDVPEGERARPRASSRT